jgi:DNA-directed RNA polymerase specialized sigma24 family protein
METGRPIDPDIDCQPGTSPGQSGFSTTHWSVVLAAGGQNSPLADTALEQLCSRYWYPLYAYLRRDGCPPPEAEDLTQAFFARVLEKNYLGQVQREKGKFRSFLLAALKHFQADERDKQRAAKRGGGTTFISLDSQAPEERYRLEPVNEMDAEKIYERRWALTVLEQSRERLREEYARIGKARLYDQLRIFEGDNPNAPTYAEAGGQLGMTESALKSAAHRLRQRYHQLVREEIAQTVATPDEIDDEIRHLITAING